jgi:hypothetical protein
MQGGSPRPQQVPEEWGADGRFHTLHHNISEVFPPMIGPIGTPRVHHCLVYRQLFNNINANHDVTVPSIIGATERRDLSIARFFTGRSGIGTMSHFGACGTCIPFKR